MRDDLGCSPSPVSREEAAQRGLSRFYTGKPCKAGHIDHRYVSNKHCVACNAAKTRLREREKGAQDPSYRMFRNVHRRARQALLGRASAVRAVGCDHVDLRDHIARQFTEGMCWGNYGQWEVDHILPLSLGQTVRELVWLCRYENLQPLWKRDNQLKGGA